MTDRGTTDELRTPGEAMSVGLEAGPQRPPQPADPPPHAPDPSDSLPLTVIEPRPGWQLLDARELWRFRELLLFLVWRDVKVRYKQTALGVGWAVAQPVATMLVFTLFLGSAGVARGIEHYPLFVFAGMVAWTFFSNTVLAAGNSIIQNERLVTKIYFPRLVVPLATAGVTLFDLLIASALLAGMVAYYGVAPGWELLMLPAVVALLGVAAAGVGVLLAALVVVQRDFKYILTFGVQLWMFATPSIYTQPESFGERAQWLLPLNPAHGLVAAFRQAATGGPIDWYAFGVSGAVGIVVALAGVMFFRRVEATFPDKI